MANLVRLLKLPEEIQNALAEASITEGHARALVSLADPKQQNALLHAIIENGLSVRQTEEAVRRLSEKREPRATVHNESARAVRAGPELPIASRAIEEELRKALGTKVQVYRSREGGKIVIYFYSEEELEWLFEKISGNK